MHEENCREIFKLGNSAEPLLNQKTVEREKPSWKSRGSWEQNDPIPPLVLAQGYQAVPWDTNWSLGKSFPTNRPTFTSQCFLERNDLRGIWVKISIAMLGQPIKVLH